MAVCELLSVGTELLLGDILNTNAQFLSRELAAMGISVWHQSTVGDNPQRLRDALALALSRSDVVITSGGLGPTADDITREVSCELFGERLILSQELLHGMQQFFSCRNAAMPKNNERQAYVPEHGTVFINNNGTAPGLALERDGKALLLLPGPPREMEPMFRESVKPFLQPWAGGLILSHTVRTMNLGESAMELLVADLMEGANPTVAPYAKTGEALLRVSARADTPEQAEALCEPVLREIQKRLGDKVYGIDSESVEQTVVTQLLAKGKTLAVAESLTGGYLAKRITDIPGASRCFSCGIVSYTNAMKQQLLQVSEQTLARYGAVSEQTALEMAQNVRRIAGADYGLSATGFAGPATQQEPACYSYIAVADKTGAYCEKVATGRTQDRDYNRYVTVSRALNLVRLRLQST